MKISSNQLEINILLFKIMKLIYKLMEEIKIIMLGLCAGKTSFLNRYFDNSFIEPMLYTYGIDCQKKIVLLPNGKEVGLVLYDTPGPERYKSINYNYIKEVDGIILMYNIREERSFKNISDLIKGVRELNNNIPVIIIGNMCDEEEYRIISKEEGEELANEYNYHFYESSNKLNINIEEPINDLIEQILKKR